MSSDSEDDLETVVAEVVPKRFKPPDLSSDIIKAIISFIIINSKIVNGVVTPARGAITRGAEKFNYSKQTISRIWRKAKANYENPDVAKLREWGKTMRIKLFKVFIFFTYRKFLGLFLFFRFGSK
jgi:hypothetical protein